MLLFFIVLWFLIHSARKPRMYRAVRRPGDTNWYIQWKQGIFRGKHPVYGIAYLKTRKQAEEEIFKLINKDNDVGSTGPWIQ